MENIIMPQNIIELIDSMLNLRLGMRQFIQRRLREEKIDLTYEMLQVLSVLWKRGDLNQQDIANNVQKNKASLTSLLDNLAKRKLIVRSEDPSDRRNKIISLTKLGREYRIQLAPIFTEFYDFLQKGIPTEAIKQVSGTLDVMHQNLM
jgi:DNA-binding MarR family transcriptional regulator